MGLPYAIKLLIVSALAAAPTGDAWFAEARGEPFSEFKATEITSFWSVTPAERSAAVALLEKRPFREISPSLASIFTGRKLSAHADQWLYLIRAVDVDRMPQPLYMIQLGDQIHITASTSDTCLIFKPILHPQPVVAVLRIKPARLSLSYSCYE